VQFIALKTSIQRDFKVPDVTGSCPVWVHFRKSAVVSARSVLPSGTDIISRAGHVRLVPRAEVMQRPDTLMQDRSPPARRNHLQCTAGPYIRVKNGSRGVAAGCLLCPAVSGHRQALSACPKSANFGSDPAPLCCKNQDCATLLLSHIPYQRANENRLIAPIRGEA
jgi:hypothetical protein